MAQNAKRFLTDGKKAPITGAIFLESRLIYILIYNGQKLSHFEEDSRFTGSEGKNLKKDTYH